MPAPEVSTALSAEGFLTDLWRDSIVPTLCDFIRIPNKSPSFDPDWAAHGHMHRAVRLLAQWCESIAGIAGRTVEIVELPGRTPTLLVDVPAFAGGTGNILIYGHYDKQPEFSGWRSGLGPWEPVFDGERLYGRGGADDGYATFASLAAIAALQAREIPHGRCLLLIEGCEESGSFDLPHYMTALCDRIGVPDLLICLDAECGTYDRLWSTSSLRGMLPGVLSVNVLTEGQHSGAAGGIVPSSFRILRSVMERVENATTGALHESLHVQIPQTAREQIRAVADLLGDEVLRKFPWAPGAGPEETDPCHALLANAWHPSLATTGIGGAPQPQDAGNTLRPGTSVKLVFRLPPTLDANAAANTIRKVLEDNPPYGAPVSFAVETPQTGWYAPETAPWLAAAIQSASHRHFGKPSLAMGMGGTIPFLRMLGESFPATQFLVTGVLGPQSNAHGPNEFLHTGTALRLTACVGDVLAALQKT
jgi:acetylornithine deacetylase/succinyl-diaminopimelate desuccinylase-like protein